MAENSVYETRVEDILPQRCNTIMTKRTKHNMEDKHWTAHVADGLLGACRGMRLHETWTAFIQSKTLEKIMISRASDGAVVLKLKMWDDQHYFTHYISQLQDSW